MNVIFVLRNEFRRGAHEYLYYFKMAATSSEVFSDTTICSSFKWIDTLFLNHCVHRHTETETYRNTDTPFTTLYYDRNSFLHSMFYKNKLKKMISLWTLSNYSQNFHVVGFRFCFWLKKLLQHLQVSCCNPLCNLPGIKMFLKCYFNGGKTNHCFCFALYNSLSRVKYLFKHLD